MRVSSIHLSIILLMMLVISAVAFSYTPTVTAQSGIVRTHTTSQLSQLWTTGIFTENAGAPGILVRDLSGDGITEIVSCAEGHPFVLRRSGETYQPVWYGEWINCHRVAAGDSDGNGTDELYFAGMVESAPGNSVWAVSVFDGAAFTHLGNIELPTTESTRGLAVGDSDGDGTLELVVTNYDTTLIYDTGTFALEWDSGFGGKDVAIGDLEGGKPRVIVNGVPAYVLDVATQRLDYGYSDGFGVFFAVGDVDSDGKDEIAYYLGQYQKTPARLRVWEGDTYEIKWEHIYSINGALDAIQVGEVDGTLGLEVIAVSEGTGPLQVHRGETSEIIYSLQNPSPGVARVAVGDPDDDGDIEMVWGAGLSVQGADSFYIGNPVTNVIEWNAIDWEGPLMLAAGDLEGDGSMELVIATTRSNQNTAGAAVTVYDAQNHVEEWRILNAGGGYGYGYDTRLALANVDDDPALEIIIGGGRAGSALVHVYDGMTHQLQWTSPVLGGGRLPMHVTNVDADPHAEIIVGVGRNLLIFDGASNTLQWDSGVLSSYVTDISVADVRGDATPELGLTTANSVYLYEMGESVTLLDRRDFSCGSGLNCALLLTMLNTDSTNAGELIVGFSVVDEDERVAWRIEAWSADDLYQVYWQDTLNNTHLGDIYSADLDSNGIYEFLLTGTTVAPDWNNSLVRIAQHTGEGYWLMHTLSRGNWGRFHSVLHADLEGDGSDEILLGSENIVQVYDLLPPILPTPSLTPSATAFVTSTPTLSPIPTEFPTATPTLISTYTPSSVPLPTATATSTYSSSATPTQTPAIVPSTTATSSTTPVGTPVVTLTTTVLPSPSVSATGIPPTPTIIPVSHILYLPLIQN
jgi:hypothetical protein